MKLAPLCIALALSSACSRTKSDPPAERTPAPRASEAEPGRPSKRVQLSAKVIDDAGIKTAAVARETLIATVDLPGTVEADPDRSARVASPVAGRLEQIAFHEGSSVKRGDVLAMLRVPDLGKARSAFAGTSAKAAAARMNADRLAGLAEKGMVARQDALSAKAEADALEAESRAAEQQLHAMGLGTNEGGAQLALRAPVSGVVVRRNAIVGQPVAPDETVASIADLSEVWFMARVFERDLEHVKVGARARVQLNAYRSQRFEGTVEYLGKEVDPSARTILARVRLPNRDDLLRIGLFGTARLDRGGVSKRPLATVIPADAVTDLADNPTVFVRVSDNTFEAREVRVGQSSTQKTEILAGVKEGELVVVGGLFSVKSALLKSTFAEEE